MQCRVLSEPNSKATSGVSVNVSVLPSINALDDVDTQETVTVWLRAFGLAISSGDEAQVASLFEQESHWRDVLAFT